MNKKKVGIFTFTCDEGCSICLSDILGKYLFKWLEVMDLAYFLAIKDPQPVKDFDIVLVEGVISTFKEKEELEKLRAETKVLIAMGSCAVTGQPSGQRNLFGEKEQAEIKDHLDKYGFMPKVLVAKDIVQVDDQVLGCPIDEDKFVEVFEKHLYS